jgi:tetratricopeptide (TPR) repeat protein
MDSKGVLANHAKRGIISSDDKKAGNLDEFYSEGYKAFLYGDYNRAIEMYRRYVGAKPEDDYVWAAYGEALLRGGMAEQALGAFRRATKIAPTKGLYYKQLAIAFDSLNNHQEAVDAAKKAIESGKADSVTLSLLGKNLIRLNRTNEAIPHLEQSLKSNRANLQAQLYLAIAHALNNEIDLAIDGLNTLLSIKTDSPVKAEAQRVLLKLRGS